MDVNPFSPIPPRHQRLHRYRERPVIIDVRQFIDIDGLDEDGMSIASFEITVWNYL